MSDINWDTIFNASSPIEFYPEPPSLTRQQENLDWHAPPLINDSEALGWDDATVLPLPPPEYNNSPLKWEFVFPRGCKPGETIAVTHKDAPGETFTVTVPNYAGPGDHMYYYPPTTANGHIYEHDISEIICAQ